MCNQERHWNTWYVVLSIKMIGKDMNHVIRSHAWTRNPGMRSPRLPASHTLCVCKSYKSRHGQIYKSLIIAHEYFESFFEWVCHNKDSLSVCNTLPSYFTSLSKGKFSLVVSLILSSDLQNQVFLYFDNLN